MKIRIGVGAGGASASTEALGELVEGLDALGFDSLWLSEVLTGPVLDPMVGLAWAAASNPRLKIGTTALLPGRNVLRLAKQLASLDRLSGGRLVLGLGLGGREDDFAASGVSTQGRGRRLEEQIAMMKRVWSGEEFGYAGAIGPEPARRGGPEIILGGATEATFDRVARIADGWIMGGGPPDMFAQAAAGVDKAWQEAGRAGRPRKLTLAYFGLGPEARSQAEGYLLHYYGWLGDIANMIAGGAAVSPEMVKSYVAAFEASGCDEIIFVPTSSRLDQISLLADAIA